MLLSKVVVSVMLAAAPSPVRARGLIDEFKFAQALKVIAEALTKPNDRETLIKLYELEGIAAGASNQVAPARASFAKLLTLDPQREPPTELSPKLRTAFFAARTQARRETLSLTARPVKRNAAQIIEQLTVAYTSSSVLPASAVRFTTASDGGQERTTSVPVSGTSGERSVSLDARALVWRVELVDEVGSVLASTAGEERAPAVVAVPAAPPQAPLVVTAPPAPASSFRVRPAGVVLGAVGVVALGVGAAFGLATSSNRSRLLDPPLNPDGTVMGLTQVEAERLRTSLPTTATLATALLIGGAAATVGGVLLALIGVNDGPASVMVSPWGVSALVLW